MWFLVKHGKYTDKESSIVGKMNVHIIWLLRVENNKLPFK